MNKWTSPGKTPATTWSTLNGTWDLAGLTNLLPSHHPLHLKKKKKKEADSTFYEIREKNVTYIFEDRRISWGKKCCSAAFSWVLFYWLNLAISSWEINYRDGYNNMPQMNQEDLLTPWNPSHMWGCVWALEKAARLPQGATPSSPPAPQPHQHHIWQRKTHWIVKGEDKNWELIFLKAHLNIKTGCLLLYNNLDSVSLAVTKLRLSAAEAV